MLMFYSQYRSPLILSKGKDCSNIHWLSAKTAVGTGKVVGVTCFLSLPATL